MRTDVILVRHAQPFIPRPGGPDDYHRSLTEEGFAQAERLVADHVRHYVQSWDDPQFARPGAESLDQLSGRATAVLTSLAQEHLDGTVVIGSHGTFISRALTGFGLTSVDWPFSREMPMPAIYRLSFTDQEVHITGPGL